MMQASMPELSTERRPTVSICIPAYNEETNIGRLLRFLESEPTHDLPIIEVLVDISGSTDRTAAIVREVASGWPVVRALDCGMREGLIASVNRLLAAARGDLVVRLDADICPQPGALDRLLARFDDPKIGIAGARIVPTGTYHRVASLVYRAEFGLHHLVCLRAPKTTNLQVLRRTQIRLPLDIGTEDNAIQDLVIAQGLQVAYVPDALLSVVPPSLQDLFRQRMRYVATTRQYIRRTRQRPSTQSPRIVVSSLLEGLRTREVPIVGLVLFLGVESCSRLLLWMREALLGIRAPITWKPLLSTKEGVWDPDPVES